MNDNERLLLSAPRLGRNHVAFDAEINGARVCCTVSRAAIEGTAEKRLNLPRDVMVQFARMRARIMAAVIAKLRSCPLRRGTVHVWSSDLDDDPAPTVPALSRALRA